MSSFNLKKATVIDGIAATEDRDSQNEILSLEGADVSEMVQRGYLNDNHGQGFANILGRIVEAKKIFKEADAKSERERAYWDRVKRPFLYVKGYLFDDADHPNAKAVASIMKEFKKMGTPLDVQMSVEGRVKERGPNGLLKESMIRNVALTLVPANKNTGAQVVDEEVKKAILARCKSVGANVGYADNLMKGLQLTTFAIAPGFIEIVEKQDPYSKVLENIAKIQEKVSMLKALTVGYGAAGSPTSRTDGSALTTEKAQKLSSTTPGKGGIKKKKEYILKSLIKKIKTNYPSMKYEEIVDNALKVFNNKQGEI